jgi:hypothetical protein
LNDLDLAWVAGIFDARGQCQVQQYRSSKNGALYYRALVRVQTLDRTLVEALVRITGVGCILRDRTRRSFHSTAAGGKGVELLQGNRWRYQVQNNTAVIFLTLIRPYLRLRAEAVDAVLETRNTGAVNAPQLQRLRELRRGLTAAQRALVKVHANG